MGPTQWIVIRTNTGNLNSDTHGPSKATLNFCTKCIHPYPHPPPIPDRCGTHYSFRSSPFV